MELSKEAFEEKMLALAACKLTFEEWETWWNIHKLAVKDMVVPSTFLLLNTLKYGGRAWATMVDTQWGAVRYLESQKIPFENSTLYKKKADIEQAKFLAEADKKFKEAKKARKAENEKLKAQYPLLFEKYPRFGNSLKNTFYDGDRIGQGVTEAELSMTPLELPEDIKQFFKIVSVIDVEGITIEFSSLRIELLCGKEYLVLGEYWKEADGDLLLINLNKPQLPTPIYYYAHGLNKVKKLCGSIDDLMEKKFSWYNNQS